MSSHSYTKFCPNCNESADALDDTRTGHHLWCMHCGCQIEPSTKQVALKTLNSWRREHNKALDLEPGHSDYLPQLKKKPKWRL